MWKLLEKKYEHFVLFIIGGLILFLLVTCSYNDQELNQLYTDLDAINYSNIEGPVVNKIERLIEETKAKPDSVGRWGKLGMNLFIHGFKKESVPIFKKAASMNKNDFRWSYFCAMALNETNSAEAVDWFEKARKLKPNYPPLCVTLGNLYLLSGHKQDAEELFNEALIDFKNVPHAYVGLAKISISQNDFDKASSYLDEALKIAPTFREAHVLLVDVYRRKGEKPKVESELTIIDKLPNKLDLKDPYFNQMMDEGVSSFWCQVRGDNYAQSGMLDKAVLEFKKVIEIKPHASFNNNLGNVYQQQRKYDLAIEQYQNALKLDSVNIDALNNLGVVYFKKGDVEKAIFFVKRSLELNPESIDGYLNLGTFYKSQNLRNEAIHYFKMGMKLAPEDNRFAYQLSWIFSSAPEKNLRDGKEALRLAKLVFEEKAIDTSSKYDLVAAALAENNQFEKAKEMAGQAYQLALKSGNRKKASEILKRVKLYEANKAFRETDG